MTPATEPPSPPTDATVPVARPGPAVAPARQRWRLYVSVPALTEADRANAGGGRGWSDITAAAALPMAGEPGRPKVAQAAPLALGMAGEREVVDLYLAERLPLADVREAIAAALPAGWSLVDLHDVWVGAPAAPAALVAADYRAIVAGAARRAIEGAVLALMAADTLPRERRREKKTTAYDLRPLIERLEVRAGGLDGVTLALRLHHAPDAVGRPDEVIAALGEPPAPALAVPLILRSIVRERLVMVDETEAPPGRPA